MTSTFDYIEKLASSFDKNLRIDLPDLLAPKTEDRPTVNDPKKMMINNQEIKVCEGPINDIVQSYVDELGSSDQPFFLFDIAAVVEKFEQWKRLLPRVEPHYAVKCNSDMTILATLAALGVKFDCASQGEIAAVLTFPQVSGKDIIYANPCKPQGHISFAKRSGVKQMTFDNLQELQKIRDVYPEAELFLRIGVDDSAALCQFSTKFGAKLSDCGKLIKAGYEMGLNIVGLSFHVGSGQQTVDAYADALDRAKSVFDLAESLGVKLSVLDIGGGFPGDENEVVFGFEQVAAAIREKIDELFPNVRVIAEPGRYFVAACGTIGTKVIALRDQTDTEASVDYLYYINDGVYGSFNNIIYDHANVVPLFLRNVSSEHLYRSQVFGPSCDGLDCLLKNYPLPRLHQNEWIYFTNMGAYTICAAASFNGFPLPSVHYIWRKK